MGNIDSEYAEYLEATAPEIVEQFNARYEAPEYHLGLCKRCGALVADAMAHSAYHHNLSLTLFVFGSTMQSIINLVDSQTAKSETTVDLDSEEKDGHTSDPEDNGQTPGENNE